MTVFGLQKNQTHRFAIIFQKSSCSVLISFLSLESSRILTWRQQSPLFTCLPLPLYLNHQSVSPLKKDSLDEFLLSTTIFISEAEHVTVLETTLLWTHVFGKVLPCPGDTGSLSRDLLCTEVTNQDVKCHGRECSVPGIYARHKAKLMG